MKVAAIIPAYNEERRIGRVLSVVSTVREVDEIVVVNDGSNDRTAAQIPRNNGIRAVDLRQNIGKGGAMHVGANHTDADVLVFLDADLVGLQPQHVGALLGPVVSGQADMSVGIFKGGRYWTDLWQRLVPYISGQRAIRRDIFLSIPCVSHSRFGVEAALTQHGRAARWRVKLVPLAGMTHIMKEEKYGFFPGLWSRTRMYADIGAYLLAEHCRNGVRSMNSKSLRPAG